MTMCENCKKPFLDCCEDRTLCDTCLKKTVNERVGKKLESRLKK